MKKPVLHIYSCSLGMYGTIEAGHGITPHAWVNEGSFGWNLANTLGYDINNRSQPGGCNFNIFQRCLDDTKSKLIQPNDLVILQYTSIDRAWSTGWPILPHGSTVSSELHTMYYQHLHNETQSLAMMVGFNLILKKLVPCNTYFTVSNDFTLLKQIDNSMFEILKSDENFINFGNGVWEYFNSLKNSDYFISKTDNHLSKNGHKFLADMYYQHILQHSNGIIGAGK